MSDKTDNRTATQRIEDLEKVVTILYQSIGQSTAGLKNLASDMSLVKDALKILNKKTEAIIQLASESTGITVDGVSNAIVKMNVEELGAQVAGYVSSGHLTASEEVADDSYLVCEEFNAENVVVNPRVQFRLDSQDQATRDSFKGKKAGDTVSFGENKLGAKILEIYALTEPKASEALAPETAPTEATADTTITEAPPDTASTEDNLTQEASAS